MNDKVNTKDKKLVSLVIPVFNEQGLAGIFMQRVTEVCSGLKDYRFQFLFVDDGSSDGTLAELLQIQQQRAGAGTDDVCIVELSRNFGKEAALSAGLDAVSGDAVIPIDVDLQDPPELIPEMLQKWQEGYEVVLACRADRQSDNWLKRVTAAAFYRLYNAIDRPEIPANCGDYRLLDRAVVDALRRLPENQRFMKGLFAWVGFRSTAVPYVRPPRRAGRSKFNGWRLLDFALQGITSFSTVPLRLSLWLGLVTTVFALVYAIIIISRVLFYGVDAPGYASMMTVILFFGGLQLTGIGFLGEYLGRNYFESKRRPPYIIRKVHQRKKAGDSN